MQPSFLRTLTVDAGLFLSSFSGLIGLATKLPLQLGHLLFNMFLAHVLQNVHSNVHITASLLDGGKSLLQHSQFGLSSNILFPFFSTCYAFTLRCGNFREPAYFIIIAVVVNIPRTATTITNTTIIALLSLLFELKNPSTFPRAVGIPFMAL